MSGIDFLKSVGGIVDSAPVRKKIEFKIKGKSHSAEIGIIEISLGDQEAMFTDAADLSITARMISKVVRVGENLDEVIPIDDCMRLHPALAAAMIKAFNEVNGEDAAKN